MKKIIKKYYLFLILFLIFILKEPIWKIFNIKENIYNTIRCNLLESDYNKLLEFSQIDLIYESNYLNTYVIFKDIYNYMNEITIRGGKDKDFDNNIVLYDNTLVGIIDKVNKNSSVVKLLTNKDIKISVKINDEIGILESKNNKLIVKNINNISNIKIGDSVFTSGLGNIKENIFIGTIKKINIDNKKIEKTLDIDYKINIKDIDFVTVIKEKK